MPREIIGRSREEAGAELAVIIDERIGNDQMRLAVDDLPIGQFVVVRVGIIEEAALLHHEPARVHARPIAAIPAERSLADRRLERGDRLGDVLALVLLAQFIMLDPAPAMAAHVEARGPDRRRGLGIAFDRERAPEHSQRQAALLEKSPQPPETDAAAIGEHAFAGEIAPLYA